MFSIEKTSSLIGDVFGTVKEFREPIDAIAGTL
jgi:methyl-coenzyme M reductase beta subunit